MAVVNEQSTDSVTQVNTKAVGETPALAMGNLLMATSQALSTAVHNSSAAQHQSQITIQAATVQGVNSLSAIGSSVIGRGAESILEKNV